MSRVALRIAQAAVLSALTLPGAFAQDAVVTGPQAPAVPVTVGPPPTYSPGGGMLDVVFTNIAGYPESVIPGLGVLFEPGTGTTHFDRPYGGPGGSYAITALADLPTSEDEVLLVNGALVAREGTPTPWVAGPEMMGPMDQRCDANESGDFVFATNTSGGPTSSDDYIIGNVGGVWEVIREGDPVAVFPGVTYDDDLDSPHILANGALAFAADNVDGGPVSTLTDDLLILGPTLIMQKGVTVPSGQAAGGSQFIEAYDPGDYWASDDGAHWLVQGDLTGPSTADDVVIVNGHVVLQEGQVIPGSNFLEPIDEFGIVNVHMDHGGNWFARGNNDTTEQDWVVRSGTVIGRTGAPIVPGTTEAWSDAVINDTFYLHVGNARGDYVLGGMTDNAAAALDSVLVWNGTDVVCRESDPIDINGNGLFDDDTYVDAFGTDDGVLTEDRILLITITIKNAAGDRQGQGLFAMDLSRTISTSYCSSPANSSGDPATMIVVGSDVVADNDVALECKDMPLNSFGFFLNGMTQAFVPNAGGSQGTLCLGGTIGRFQLQIQFSGTTRAIGIPIDLTNIPQPTGSVAVLAGQTWNFQTWYRDAVGGQSTSNFSDGVSVTFQ